jgi:(R,R)-butanediol dehydrogenase / meso-butanediol dehydrogenase / diacetyl reductase
MKAAVWHKRGDIRIEELPDPKPGIGQVKVRVKACGICGSDLHEFERGPLLIPLGSDGQGQSVVLGHEFSAEIVELGHAARRFEIGDRITMNPLIFCGECDYCKQKMHHLCFTVRSKGFSENGGFAEFALLDENSLHKLPQSISDDMGALVEPLAVAIHAVKRSRIRIGDSTAVIGAGPIGLLVMQVCIAAGAKRVFVVETMEARREIARQLGANDVFDPSALSPAKGIKGATAGLGASIAFDCAGSQSSFDTSVKVTRSRGLICVVGVAQKPITAPFSRLLAQEKEISFSNAYEDEFSMAIALLADRRVDVESLISARIPLQDIVSKGMKPLIEQTDRHIKILVCP